MEIVPKDDKLIIEARVMLNDIDIVHAGLPARIRLSAYKARKVPVLDATVISVSADRVVDKNTGAAFYLARVEVDEDEMKNHLSEHVELYPGMPADVLIVTGSRTLLSYLMTPITDSMFHAFREQ
jgi:HlyD family type I secretion membrane fusion protein